MPDDILQRNILEQLKNVRMDIRDLRSDMDAKYSQLDTIYVRKDVYTEAEKEKERRMADLEAALSIPRILSYISMICTIIVVILALHANHIIF